MTCPFYVVADRPECILGDTRAERHCGPRTYPAHSCALDAIGEWGAWRSVLPEILEMLLATPFSGDPIADDILGIFFKAGAKIHLDAVGWLQ